MALFTEEERNARMAEDGHSLTNEQLEANRKMEKEYRQNKQLCFAEATVDKILSLIVSAMIVKRKLRRRKLRRN